MVEAKNYGSAQGLYPQDIVTTRDIRDMFLFDCHRIKVKIIGAKKREIAYPSSVKL